MILRHLIFVHFAVLIGLVKERRPVFADYRKIMPKWCWNSKKDAICLQMSANSLGFDDPKYF